MLYATTRRQMRRKRGRRRKRRVRGKRRDRSLVLLGSLLIGGWDWVAAERHARMIRFGVSGRGLAHIDILLLSRNMHGRRARKYVTIVLFWWLDGCGTMGLSFFVPSGVELSGEGPFLNGHLRSFGLVRNAPVAARRSSNTTTNWTELACE